MPPLRLSIRRSAHLRAQSKIVMASDAPHSMGGNGDPQPLVPSQSRKAAAAFNSNPQAPAALLSPPTGSTSQVKHMGKRAQDPSAGSEGVQWEQLPYLTEKLLLWLLDNPADRAILFNEKKDQVAQGNAVKPHAQRKKDIHAVIASFLFSSDPKYGDKYTANPGKFASAVNARLTSLKAKYRQQASRFKSTGEGISPDDPHHQNLREKVIAEFPFWEQCDLMWHGNPSYNAKLFDAAPGTNRTSDFLSIIKNSGRIASSAGQQDESSEHHDNIPAPAEDPGVNQDDPNPPTDVTMSEQEREEVEEEEEEEDEEFGYGIEDDFVMAGGPEDQLSPGADKEVDCRRQPISYTKMRPPSSDGRGVFRMSPYPRGPTSIISTTSTLSTLTSSSQCYAAGRESSQTSVMKGKSTLAQMKTDLDNRLEGLGENSSELRYQLSVLKTERKTIKTQAHMHNKEITYLERERERERVEAERIHHRQMESKQLDIQALQEETRVLGLKLELAKLQAANSVSSSTAPSPDCAGPSV
ncbi:hypothetical protein PISMIDRAFT_17491 [Pisolithus microcarpus 441]|uniref:Uncharacterized protein n=1 Tax=Pisolithus microcarpus 441 TaxID=765257 RepID=A0A0C9YBG8_9AGAM|nr:hypothetical protein PISMIDRAFT_17491 [Pisolithus microcarpus 441]